MPRMRQLKITKQVTNRESKSFDTYLKEIGHKKLITAQEEVELARRIKQGDELAKERLVSANLRFVVSVAKQYQGHGLGLPDLISEGNIGLVKAAGRFDETRGFKFISYAVWWIRQQILQSLAEQSRVVRLPLNKIGSINKINKAFAKLEQQYERSPTAEELAESLEMTLEEVKTGLANNSRHVSMDAPLSDGEVSSGTLLDKIESGDRSTEEMITYSDLRSEIERVLGFLSTREADVVCLYFGLRGNQPHTLEEIGAKFDLTRERARQIKERGVRRLKFSGSSRVLRKFLG